MYRIYLLFFVLLSGCATLKAPVPYKYVIFLYQTEQTCLIQLLNLKMRKVSFEMIQVNQRLEAISDTMLVWMEHFSPGAQINETEAMNADLLIMCYPDFLPQWAVAKHVFPWHEGEIHLYTVSENVIVVSNKRIDLFDLVLQAHMKDMQEIAGR